MKLEVQPKTKIWKSQFLSSGWIEKSYVWTYFTPCSSVSSVKLETGKYRLGFQMWKMLISTQTDNHT